MLHGIMQQFLHQVDWGRARLPGHRPAAGHRRRAADAGPVAAADRRGGGVHAAGGRASGRDPRRLDVPQAQGADPGDGREHELLRHAGLPCWSTARPRCRQLAGGTEPLFAKQGDDRVYVFGKGGARRRAEQLGVPFLGEVPLNVGLREVGDEGRIREAFEHESPVKAELLRRGRATGSADQRAEPEGAQAAQAGDSELS